MLEGIEGLKLLKESYYYKLNDIGFIMLFIGIVLFLAGLLLMESYMSWLIIKRSKTIPTSLYLVNLVIKN